MLLGFASGLPLPLTTGTLQGWMASEKVDLTIIGIFSLVGLPYTLKFLWSPLMDRFMPPFLGRRTGWIAIFQMLLMISISVMAFSDPVRAPGWLATIAFIVAFLSASQDIVIDAYRADVLEKQEMGPGAAVTVLGARLALLVSGALAFMLSDHMSWKQVYLIMAAILGIGFVTTWFSPKPREDFIPPKTISEAVTEPILDYFKRETAIELLIFIVLYKLGDAVAGAMTTPFLIDLGFTRTAIGGVNKGFGMFMTIFGALFGGAVVVRIGILRSLWTFGILQCLSNFAFVALAEAGKHYPLLVLCIGVENICGGMGTAAFVAFLMSLCNKRFTATQYALLSSAMAITRTIAGAPTGYMAKYFGWTWFFVISAVLAVPGLLLLARLKRPGFPTKTT